MPAPVPSRRWSLPTLEAAIVATELRLSDRLAYLAWCGSVGRGTTVAATLVRSAERHLELLWQERDWRLVLGRDAGDLGSVRLYVAVQRPHGIAAVRPRVTGFRWPGAGRPGEGRARPAQPR